MKKKQSQEEHKRKCLEGMGPDAEKQDGGDDNNSDDEGGDDEEFTSDEDDAEYFR